MSQFFDKSDTQIQQDVLNEIKWDPSVTSSQICVSAKDGIVTLSGSVPHYFEKSQAEEAAHRVGGVRAVADEVQVDMMGSYQRGDTLIAEAALDDLRWNYSAPKGLQVTVENGWITLKGDAEWHYQRNEAEEAVNSLMGVRGVSNNISIRSKLQPSDVKSCIEDSLKRSALSEGHQISVAIEGDTVILTGKVHSRSEFDDAGNAAWMAPGIKAVENNVRIVQ